NSTAVLDRVQQLLQQQQLRCLRLDGSTPEAARAHLVDLFNSSSSTRAFLLSSKAGGTGLNLTGASRLVHFDPDWQVAVQLFLHAKERSFPFFSPGTPPTTSRSFFSFLRRNFRFFLQFPLRFSQFQLFQKALSRIWRDGQTQPVYIYRLVGAGTVEARIIRRQLFKNSLAKQLLLLLRPD
ncbi:hypothetical protein ETH_00020165, partial [Eimeria tenella]